MFSYNENHKKHHHYQNNIYKTNKRIYTTIIVVATAAQFESLKVKASAQVHVLTSGHDESALSVTVT